MQSLVNTTTPSVDEQDWASLVIETMLLGMRLIRSEMQARRPSHLTVPQFRTLAFLHRHQGASLSELADHLDLALPSTSRAVDHLVRNGLVVRETSPDDRRRIRLSHSEEGARMFQAAADAARARMRDVLNSLTPKERSQVTRGVGMLQAALQRDHKDGGV